MSFVLLFLGLVPGPYVSPPRSVRHSLDPALARASPPAPADRGRVTWFEGTFEQALAEATRTKKLVFLDLWATWCGWCKRFDHDTLNDTAVVAELKEMICLAVDAESPEGQP